MTQPSLLHASSPSYSPFGVDCLADEALASPFQHALGGGGGVGGGDVVCGGASASAAERALEIGQLPYRQSVSLLPSQAADVPADHHLNHQQQLQLLRHRQRKHIHHLHINHQQHHLPTNANAHLGAGPLSHANQRSTAAVAANHVAAACAAAAAASTAANNRTLNVAPPPLHPLQLSGTTVREAQWRDLVRRKHLRDAQDRDPRERARARKLSRAAVRASRHYGMEGGTTDYGGIGEDEMAEMQKLSNDYQPEVSGPDVSECISTEAIAEEYAGADPTYQVKTASLPQSYPLYRRCKGDGHCGWRSIAFCYYETLLYLNSKQTYREEETRIRSLSNLLKAVGHEESLFEAFEDEVLDLLTALSNSTSIKEGEALLLSKFNDPGTWQSIITYFKILASSWIRTRRDQYEPYMQGMTADEYCAANIDPFQAEIDETGLSALAECLLKPIGLAMEVHYLDLSAGDKLTVHQYNYPSDNGGLNLPSPPVIRLLYRPGHYDILYAFDDALVQSQQSTLPGANVAHPAHGDNIVLLASPSDDSPHGLQSTPSSYIPFAEGIAMIPGLSNMNAANLGALPGPWMAAPSQLAAQYPSTSAYEYSAPPIKVDYGQAVEPHPAPVQPLHSIPLAPLPPRIAPAMDPSYSHHSPIASTPTYSMPLPPTYIDAGPTPCSHHQAPVATAAPPIQHGSEEKFSFRPSKFEWEPRWSEATLGGPNAHAKDLGFQTSIFRNSHFNVAHFNNPDFEPEMWRPGQEGCDKGRRKSMAQ